MDKPKEELPKNEAEHDAQVAAGLAALDKEQQKEDQDHNGALTQDEAVEAAQKVKAAYPVFKSITPMEQGGRWVFKYGRFGVNLFYFTFFSFPFTIYTLYYIVKLEGIYTDT